MSALADAGLAQDLARVIDTKAIGLLAIASPYVNITDLADAQIHISEPRLALDWLGQNQSATAGSDLTGIGGVIVTAPRTRCCPLGRDELGRRAGVKVRRGADGRRAGHDLIILPALFVNA